MSSSSVNTRLKKAQKRYLGKAPKPTTGENVARFALGGIMTYAGISHLTTNRQEFQAQVPDWMPLDEDIVVLGSGVAEIALGVALAALPEQRRPVGVALAAFYAVIFPGNIGQYAERKDGFGLDTDGKRLARLFGQPALIAAALKAAGLPK